MHFGFYLPCYWPDTNYSATSMYGEMLEQAVLADNVGCSSVWVPEHHFINLTTVPNPLLVAVKVADATKRVRITTSVLVLPFFDVRRLAGEICLADHLTNGRIDIGVGRGAFPYEFERFGVPFDRSRAVFDESLTLLERLLTEYDVSSDTDLYRFPSLSITPRPLQRPHPPIWIASVTQPAIYHSAHKGYNVMTTPLRSPFQEAQGHSEAFYKGVAESVSKSAIKPKLSILRMTYVAKDKADAEEKLRLAYANDERHFNLRQADARVERGAAIGRATGRTMAEVADALMIGTADELLGKIEQYTTLGLHELLLNMSFGAPHRDVMGSLERFATHILPHLPKEQVHALSA